METASNPNCPEDKTIYDCIVISDLHLGSDVCQARLLEEFLIWAVEHCRELVINGDIFDDLNFKRLTKRHFACLRVITPPIVTAIRNSPAPYTETTIGKMIRST